MPRSSLLRAPKRQLPKWLKKLTAKERKHLKEMGITSLRGMKVCAEHQKKWRDEAETFSEPCFECKGIANKLGLPV